jgi:hypothetical protein
VPTAPGDRDPSISRGPLAGQPSIAAVIGRRLRLPVKAMPQDTYGPLGPIFATDQPSSSIHTRQTLGWEPKHASLLEDLEKIRP